MNTASTTPKEHETVVVGKDDMNIVEVPFTLLDKRRSKDLNVIKTQYLRKNQETGEIKECYWEVYGHPELGLPTFPEEEIFVGLMELSYQQGFHEVRVHTSKCKLLRTIHWPLDGRYLKRLEQGLDRLAAIRIKTNDFWDNEVKQYGTLNFGIIQTYMFFDNERRGRRNKNQDVLPLGFIDWNQKLFEESFRKHYIRTIDTELYFNLSTPVSKRLYRYTGKYLYWDRPVEWDLYYLAFEKLGISRKLYPAHIKKILSGAIKEHNAKKIAKISIRSVKRSELYPSGYKVVITPIAESNIAVSALEPELTKSRETSNPLAAKLISRGVTERIAKSLVRKYCDRIESKIEVFDWILPTEKAALRNPAGFLRRSIEEDWQTPPGFVSKAELERRKKETEDKRTKREEEERRRQELIDRQAEEREKKAEESPWKELWDQILVEIKQRVRRDSYKMWFETAFISEVTEEGVVVIDCNSEFAVNWMYEYYHRMVQEVLTEIEGEAVRVEFACNIEEVELR